MKTNEQLEKTENLPVPNTAETDGDSIDRLRQILAEEQNREVTRDEAADVGESLITFFKVLAAA